MKILKLWNEIGRELEIDGGRDICNRFIYGF
jgi:hypothetical protein